MATRRPTPERYNAFISQIELQRLWVEKATIANNVGAKRLDDPTLDIKTSPSYEAVPSGFKALQTYTITVTEGTATAGKIEVTFAIEYSSKLKLTESLFSVFREINLPLNTWPYLRSFVAESFGKMGWAPHTLPAFKPDNNSQ